MEIRGKVFDLKVVLLGKEGIGKTCLVDRYIRGLFCKHQYEPTIGGAFSAKQVSHKDHPIKVCIWDTSGSGRYECMNRVFYRSAKAAVVCYDLTDRESWDKAKEWVLELRSHEKDCRVYIVGTKLDLVTDNRHLRRLDRHKAEDYASGVGAIYFETSSRTGQNVDALFERIVQDFGENPANFKPSGGISLHESSRAVSHCYPLGCPCWFS